MKSEKQSTNQEAKKQMGPKKAFWVGAVVGVVLVPVATLGLIIPFVEEISRFILVVPRLLTSLLIDTETAPGALSIVLFAVLSGLFFGGIGWLYAKIMNRQSKQED